MMMAACARPTHNTALRPLGNALALAFLRSPLGGPLRLPGSFFAGLESLRSPRMVFSRRFPKKKKISRNIDFTLFQPLMLEAERREASTIGDDGGGCGIEEGRGLRPASQDNPRRGFS